MTRLEKSIQHRWFAGVASGLAKSFGIDTFAGRMLVRAGFVVFAGALWWIYGLLWLFIPSQELIDARSLSPEAMEQTEYQRLKAKRKALKREYKRIKREAKRSYKRYRYAGPELVKSPPPSVPTLSPEAKVAKLVEDVADKLPEKAVVKLRNIHVSLAAVLPELEKMRRHNSKDAYNVEQIAETYLPDALERYLALPTDFAKHTVLSNGKTAEATLLEQLSLLERSLQRIASDVFREDADALMVHGRFLKEKFGEQPLDIPSAAQLRQEARALGKGDARAFTVDEAER